MRIVVMGTGGLGGYFGGLLARSGAEVTFIARGAHLQALQDQGLTVQSINGDFAFPVHACESPEGLPPADVVLFCVKTYASDNAIALLQPIISADTIILTLQNGVDTPAQLQAALGRGAVLAGVTRTGSTLTEPGVIVQETTDRTIEFGSWDGLADSEVEHLRNLLAKADIPVVVATDIQRVLWEKLVMISAFSGLSALTGLSAIELLTRAPTRQLYTDVMAETAATGQAAGVHLDPQVVSNTLMYLDAQDDLGQSSMAVDFKRRRPIEVDAIHGAIVRHGQRLRVPTPVNATIYSCLTVMDQIHRGL